MGLCAAAALGLVGGGVWFYHGQQISFRQEAERHLQTIARLKAHEITLWRAERLGDAVVLMSSEFFEEAVGRWMKTPEAATAEKILRRFRATANSYHYRDVLLADTNGQVRLSLSGYRGPLSGAMMPDVAAALRTRQAVLTDLHVGPEGPKAHMEAIAPLFAQSAGAAEAVGLVILQSEADEYLYPLIASWPVPSPTAETLLVRRDGKDVLFLNDLRHRRNAALHLRIPLSRINVPSVMAILGRRGLVEGLDYRGVPVVSILEAIPGSSWHLVAKMDTAEIFGPLRARAWTIGAVVLLLIVIMALALVFLRHRLAAAEALRVREENLAVTLRCIGDGVLATDAQGRITRLNLVAERLTGWTVAEAMGRPVAEVFRIMNEETRQPTTIPVEEVLASGEVRGLANHTVLIARDGTERPIDDSVAPLRRGADQLMGVVLVFRDATARRRADQAIRRANESLERRVQERTAAVAEGLQRLALATESAHLGIWDWDIVNNRMTWDDWMFRLYGIAEKPTSYGVEIWEHGLHPDDKASAWEASQTALRGEKPYDTEFRVQYADGTVKTLKSNGVVLRDAGGQPLRMIGVNYDVTEQRQAEETIRRTLVEKEALLREVHHRVKNNLQIVSSLISLQMRHLEDPRALAALRDTDIRIRSMAVLHENLYQSEGMDRVRCGDYFRHLAVQLTALFDIASRGIALQIEVRPAELTLSLDKAVPCGLLVTELITNAIKHAFPAGRRGTVNVAFTRDDSGRLRLRVRDDGVGLPEHTGPAGQPSLGMQLVAGFAQQIRATMEIRRAPGTCFDLRFDAEEP